jgi:ABC-type uncharacterized transport system permease subunit
VLAAAAGAAWAAIAGFLKATVGVHEVISTIMLNWIAIWVTQALVGQGGQLQNATDKSVPVSSDIVDKAHLPVFWGDPLLQGLHIGFFIALASPLAYWLLLSRTTLGYEVRATGFNPEAARYGGVPLAALLFGALLQGTSTRNPAIQDVIKPELAGNLTLIIQGLVLLFVGADLLFLWLWKLRKKISRAPAAAAQPGAVAQ